MYTVVVIPESPCRVGAGGNTNKTWHRGDGALSDSATDVSPAVFHILGYYFFFLLSVPSLMLYS